MWEGVFLLVPDRDTTESVLVVSRGKVLVSRVLSAIISLRTDGTDDAVRGCASRVTCACAACATVRVVSELTALCVPQAGGLILLVCVANGREACAQLRLSRHDTRHTHHSVHTMTPHARRTSDVRRCRALNSGLALAML